MTSSPAASWTRTASSTARSSICLNAAAPSSPASARARASTSSVGRSKLPTTSLRIAAPTPPASSTPDAIAALFLRGRRARGVGPAERAVEVALGRDAARPLRLIELEDLLARRLVGLAVADLARAAAALGRRFELDDLR